MGEVERSGATRRRTTRAALAVAAALAVLVGAGCDVLPPAPPGGVAADCRDVAWGSGTKSFPRMTTSPITGVRAGRHHCFDRVVIDLASTPAGGWNVEYGPVEEPGTGDPVPVRGGASIEVIVRAPDRTLEGTPTFTPADPDELVPVGGYLTLRQAVFVGTFEGQSTFGLGVRGRLPFRVFAIEEAGRARLVVDVAHRWP
jgi:hypothetical protein